MENEKFIGTILVSNKQHKDLFRVHIFEHSIQFDEHFAKGVIKNKVIVSQLSKVNKLWQEKKIKKDEIFFNVIPILEKHEQYLSKFFFKEEELDEYGRYKDNFNITPNQSTIDQIPSNPLSSNEKVDKYFKHLKDTNKTFKKITRKNFELYLKDKEVIDYYIDNYNKRKATFFNYQIVRPNNIKKNCFLMVVGDKIRIGFAI